MYQKLQRLSGTEMATWAGAVVAALATIFALAVPAGGTNRVAAAAVPLVFACGLLVANALAWQRMGWVGALVYGGAALAFIYALLLALSVPVRLQVEGFCPQTQSSCPLGYAHPITGAENLAVYAVAGAGALGLMLVFLAFEVRHLHRRPRRRLGQPQQ